MIIIFHTAVDMANVLTAYLLITDNEFEKLTTMRSHDLITQQKQHIITYLIKIILY